MQYALSDKPICDHEHTNFCTSCENLDETKKPIDQCFKSLSFSDEQIREELQYDIESYNEKIINWRNHYIRSVNQDLCKKDSLKQLKENQVFITADWTMKYLPQSFRETQSEWFGKPGFCALFLEKEESDGEKTFEIRSYVHLVENGTEGWFTVSQILHHTLCMLKEQTPNLSEVFMKSDKAGSLPLMAYLWKKEV